MPPIILKVLLKLSELNTVKEGINEQAVNYFEEADQKGGTGFFFNLNTLKMGAPIGISRLFTSA